MFFKISFLLSIILNPTKCRDSGTFRLRFVTILFFFPTCYEPGSAYANQVVSSDDTIFLQPSLPLILLIANSAASFSFKMSTEEKIRYLKLKGSSKYQTWRKGHGNPFSEAKKPCKSYFRQKAFSTKARDRARQESVETTHSHATCRRKNLIRTAYDITSSSHSRSSRQYMV